MDNGQNTNSRSNSETFSSDDNTVNAPKENLNLDLTNEGTSWNVETPAENAMKQLQTNETENVRGAMAIKSSQETAEKIPDQETTQKMGEVVNLDYMPPNFENKENTPNKTPDNIDPTNIDASIDSNAFSEKKYSISPEALKVTIEATEEFNKGEIVPDEFYRIVRQKAVKKYIKHSFKREVAVS